MSIHESIWVKSVRAGRLYKELTGADAAFDIALSKWDVSNKKADEEKVFQCAERVTDALDAVNVYIAENGGGIKSGMSVKDTLLQEIRS